MLLRHFNWDFVLQVLPTITHLQAGWALHAEQRTLDVLLCFLFHLQNDIWSCGGKVIYPQKWCGHYGAKKNNSLASLKPSSYATPCRNNLGRFQNDYYVRSHLSRIRSNSSLPLEYCQRSVSVCMCTECITNKENAFDWCLARSCTVLAAMLCFIEHLAGCGTLM